MLRDEPMTVGELLLITRPESEIRSLDRRVERQCSIERLLVLVTVLLLLVLVILGVALWW